VKGELTAAQEVVDPNIIGRTNMRERLMLPLTATAATQRPGRQKADIKI
jgi:hypothetical protein